MSRSKSITFVRVKGFILLVESGQIYLSAILRGLGLTSIKSDTSVVTRALEKKKDPGLHFKDPDELNGLHVALYSEFFELYKSLKRYCVHSY